MRIERCRHSARVGIDKVSDLYARHAGESSDMRLAPAVQAGDAQSDDAVGAEHAAGGLGPGHGDCRRRGQRFLEETSTVEGHG